MGIEENKALVREYFRRMQAGEATVADLMADDVTWWVPQSSELGGTHRGKAAVLAIALFFITLLLALVQIRLLERRVTYER